MHTDPIHAVLLHLSYNFWGDWQRPEAKSPYYNAKPFLRFDQALWDDLLLAMSRGGLNTLVLDLGDGIVYRSHPEIAVDGAWTPKRLREELKKARDLGLEPIPKLNFSAAHDTWLGVYARMVSTPQYYQVARDLIDEVAELFDGPRLFHLGMDEELAKNQKFFEHVVVRQYGLWWRDLNFFIERVHRNGARPWIWSDYVWDHSEMFYQRMPQSVVQSNWYYGVDFTSDPPPAVRAYREIDEHGYDQIPTLSNWHTPENIDKTIEYCRQHVAPQRLKGFVLTPWRPTLEECRVAHLEAIERFSQALSRRPDEGTAGEAPTE